MSINKKKEESDRVAELRRYEILDSLPETAFDDIVKIASTLCEVPISMVSLLDENRQWFKACVGLTVKETQRDIAFCDHVVRGNAPLIIEDTTLDPRFKDNPLVTAAPFLKFYAGFPLVSRGHILGTLCIADTKPKVLSSKDSTMLEALSRQVMSQLELRLALRRQAELQVKVQAENIRFSTLVENLKEVVFQTDEKGHWTFLSSSWEKIFGLKVQDCLGKSYINFVSPEDRPKNQEKFLPFGDEKQDFSRRFVRFLDIGNRPVWVEIFERRLYSHSGEFIGTSGTLTDVSEQISQNKIIEDQKVKMIQASRLYALGEMAAGISHEINNPLAIIRGTTQLLGRALSQDKVDKVVIQETVAKIESTVDRISKVISGLKSFARDGENDPFVRVSLDTVISDSLELCQTRFRNAGVQVDIVPSDEDILVECRPVQLSQVLLNLLNNAFDALQKSAVKKIRIEKITHTNNVVIKIFDTGTGVPKQIRDRIMEPFFTTKGPFKGMGLGLSLSKGIVESHKGTLLLSEEQGETCFSITLPKKHLD